MKLPSLMKINSYKRFSFSPRYYDERKERLDQIKAKYSGEENIEATKGRLKGSFKRSNMKRTKDSNFRLVFIILILAFLAWWFILR